MYWHSCVVHAAMINTAECRKFKRIIFIGNGTNIFKSEKKL